MPPDATPTEKLAAPAIACPSPETARQDTRKVPRDRSSGRFTTRLIPPLLASSRSRRLPSDPASVTASGWTGSLKVRTTWVGASLSNAPSGGTTDMRAEWAVAAGARQDNRIQIAASQAWPLQSAPLIALPRKAIAHWPTSRGTSLTRGAGRLASSPASISIQASSPLAHSCTVGNTKSPSAREAANVPRNTNSSYQPLGRLPPDQIISLTPSVTTVP